MSFNIDDIDIDALIEDLYDFSVVNDNPMCAKASQVISLMKTIILDYYSSSAADDNLE